MWRSEIQSLGWVAPSRRLSDTLLRADQLAGEQHHRELMLEHLVFGLTDDTDAARVLEANGVDVTRFRDYIARYIAAIDYRWPAGAAQPPVPDATLKRIFDVASAAAETSDRSEIDGALIVAAIIGEGKSNAAEMFQQHGLNVDDDDGNRTEVDAPIASTPPDSAAPTLAPGTVQPATSDLTEIHRMLSTPTEPRVAGTNGGGGHAVPAPGQSDRDKPNAPAVLQRTRPKARVAQNRTPLPKAVLNPNPTQGQPTTQTPPLANQPQQMQYAQHRPAAQQAAPAASAPQPIAQSPSQAPVTARAPVPAPPPPPPVQPPPTMDAGSTSAPPPSTTPDEQDTPEQTATTEPVEGFAQIDANILTEILPTRMGLGASEIVEIRVLNSDIDLLTGQFEGRDIVHSGGKLVSRCLSLRLLSSTNGFSIEPRAPEVQWIDTQTPVTGDEATSWRWQVTGHRQGKAKLRLVAMARTVSSDGTVLETSMPEQAATVNIKRSFGAGLKRILFILALLGLGRVAGLIARPAYRMVETILLG